MKGDGVLDETCQDLKKVKNFQKMLDTLELRKISENLKKLKN